MSLTRTFHGGWGNSGEPRHLFNHVSKSHVTSGTFVRFIATRAVFESTSYVTRSTASGQVPQIIALLGNLPLAGANILNFFFFSSTSEI